MNLSAWGPSPQFNPSEMPVLYRLLTGTLKADKQFKRALELKPNGLFVWKRMMLLNLFTYQDLSTREEQRFSSLEQTVQFLQNQPH
jgi:hypothetical protein